MLGLSPWVPKFVKRYTNLGPSIEAAVSAYAEECAAAPPAAADVYPLKGERSGKRRAGHVGHSGAAEVRTRNQESEARPLPDSGSR